MAKEGKRCEYRTRKEDLFEDSGIVLVLTFE